MRVTSTDDAAASSEDNDEDRKSEKKIIIKALEEEKEGEPEHRKDVAWLGIFSEEASETLTSQLKLDPGVGLVVSFVVSNSPAAKAGIKKHDLLVEFDGQSLVHPAQLRKLVRAHKEGDTVKLGLYRSGKKQTVTATLGKTHAGFGMLEDGKGWRIELGDLKKQLADLPLKENLHEQMKTLHDSLSNMKIDLQIDGKKLQGEIHRSMEAASKAIHEALRNSNDSDASLGPARKALEEIARSGVAVDKDASVTVRSSSKKVKSLVKADDSGTIVLVSNPKLRLTAHDKEGKLLFDGEIETTEQRDQVPRDLWEKVEPLLDQFSSKARKKAEAEE